MSDDARGMNERWVIIAGFPSYEVSSFGRVRSLFNSNNNARREPLLLKPTVNREGYQRYALRIDREQRHRFAQRLVLESFVGPCPTGMECRHLDGNPSNNRLGNLAWGTKQQNMGDQRAHGTLAAGENHYAKTQPHRLARGSAHGCAKLNEQQVMEIRQSNKSMGVLAKMHGVHRRTISRILRGERWSHVG
jgi:hypothetical protein